VADCTGHGVPGALMTMVSYSNLIEIISNDNLDAGEILSRLHTQIFNKLQQHKGDEYSQDGLDISLAIINDKALTVQFSAARNHGYIVRDNEVSTLKANSRSIGGLSGLGEIEPERNFDTVTTDIKKGDVLILTTDGIIDQLNQKDEKFGYARFKDLLLEICQTNLTQGEETMDNYFSRWKGKLAQLDDLLVIGFRI
jgi:serine phosphatase RsbU (regulator of sigma subunit)